MQTKFSCVAEKYAVAAALALGLGLASPARAEASPSEAPGSVEEPQSGLSFASSYTLTGKTKMKAGGQEAGKADLQEYSFDLSQKVLPRFTVGISYQQAKVGADADAEAKAPLPEDLRSLSIKASYVQPLDSDWSLMVFGSPDWNTTQGSILDSDGLGVTTGFQFIKRVSPTFTYALGAAYNSQAMGSLKVLPVFGLRWDPEPEWTLSLGFPKTGVTYHFSQQLSLSLQVEGSGGSYYVKDDPLPSVAGKPSLADTNVNFYDVRVGLALDYAFDKTTSVSLSVGQTLARRFDYHDRDYEVKSSNTAPYFTVSANFAF